MSGPSTLDELLIKTSSYMNNTFGDNPLADPSNNRSDPLVKLVTGVLLGQVELEKRFDALKNASNAKFLEGEALEFYANQKCLPRKQNTRSRVQIVVTGEDCAILQQGFILKDDQGRDWEVENDITLQTNGTGCAFGVGIARASDFGCWLVQEKELFLSEESDAISDATNTIQLEKGGVLESEDAWRNRLFGSGIYTNINGTLDNLLAAINELDGVNFVRGDNITDCNGNNGAMLVVHGGNDAEICQVFFKKSGITCNTFGNVSCETALCDGGTPSFQRPCPVQISVRVSLSCGCISTTEDEIRSIILANASFYAKSRTISAKQILKLHREIESVQIRAQRIELSCVEATIVDPISQQILPFSTEETQGFCRGVTFCENAIQPWTNTIKLPLYEYPIVNTVEFADCIDENSADCIACDTVL